MDINEITNKISLIHLIFSGLIKHTVLPYKGEIDYEKWISNIYRCSPQFDSSNWMRIAEGGDD